MKWLSQILSFLLKILSNKKPSELSKSNLEGGATDNALTVDSRGLRIDLSPIVEESPINWNDSKCKISKHFTVGEATWLPQWLIFHTPSAQERTAILNFAKKMDRIRDFLNQPIIIHNWIRPPKLNCVSSPYHGKDYNRAVYEQIWKRQGLTKEMIDEKKEPNSAHKYGIATDWHAKILKCKVVRQKLQPKLVEFDIRIEDIKGNWVHTDEHEPGPSGRFFKPY